MGDYGNTGTAEAMTQNDEVWSAFHGKRADTYPVACGHLGSYLRAAGVNELDFWSLDVEGSELRVLQAMDWDIPIRIIIVELNPIFPANSLQAVRDFLKSKGFVYLERQVSASGPRTCHACVCVCLYPVFQSCLR